MTLKARITNLEARHMAQQGKPTRTLLCGPGTDEATIAKFERRAEMDGYEVMIIRLVPGKFQEPSNAEH
jgi:hypothetical protein